MTNDEIAHHLRPLFDPDWYLETHPDVAAVGIDPLFHYIAHGADEGRDPNPFFNGAWYLANHGDVGQAQINPLLHYLLHGAGELRNPHPRFDAAFYAEEHPDSVANVLLYHMVVGRQRGFAVEPTVEIADYLASARAPLPVPEDVAADIIVPVYRGLAQTRACLESVLADPHRMPGLLIVIDDRSPEPAVSAYLDELNARGAIRLIRNARNLGFVASVNRGMEVAGARDVVLLNSDTRVPSGWMPRLAAHAYSTNRTGTVSPMSNNATICSYPSIEGGPMPDGVGLATMDDAARVANAGRHVELPTTVGFCMYIRRTCLSEVGAFDAAAFGRGYGEEVDFCLRARARGWRHLMACDVFVYHEGEVSFGAKSVEQTDGHKTLVARYPDYANMIERHVRRDPAGPARFALMTELWRRSGLPVILMITHGLGGGVGQHIARLVTRLSGRANILTMEAVAGGVSVTAPTLGERPRLLLPMSRAPDLLTILRAARVSRAHVHHVLGVSPHPRALIEMLGVAFDFTAHDYLSICPQVNLLPVGDEQYCGEPDAAGCNACIARRPSHGARDILSWRAEHAWLLRDADRVLCPSQDVLDRLARYAPAADLVLAPHEPVEPGPWVVKRPALSRRGRLRVALLGVLADHKGVATVAAVAEAADPNLYEFYLIGPVERPLPPAAASRITIGGAYVEAELPARIAALAPHVVWFPAQWPETYSYTLSAALSARLPIVASDLGAFVERLDGRPETWLVSADAPADTWLHAFDRVREELLVPGPSSRGNPRPPIPDFYADDYLAPARSRRPATRHAASDRPLIVIVPERLDTGILSPCAYIRLLLPLHHPAIATDYDTVIASPAEAMRHRAAAIVTHRHALRDPAEADALLAHCRASNTKLVYDIDDDLVGIPGDHPEAARLRPLARIVEQLSRAADSVWVSTEALRDRLAPLRARTRADIRVILNGLDEGIWTPGHRDPRTPTHSRASAMRVLVMGTATHDHDFAQIRPALRRLHEELGDRISIDVIGMVPGNDLPPWLNRLYPPPIASASYPGFVDWITHLPGWDVGLAPIADTPFNAAKSAIKTLDYAALGLAVLASDVPAYRGSLADDAAGHPVEHNGGLLIPNTTAAWVHAVSRLVRNPRLRTDLAAGARRAFSAHHTLAAQAASRRAALIDALTTPRAPAPAARRAARASPQSARPPA